MQGLALLALIAFVSGFLRWRTCVHMALVLVVLEGALRKWVLPGQELGIYFLKDVTLFVAYVKYHRELGLRSTASVPPLIILLATFSFLAAFADAFNPLLSSAVVGFFGLKAYFFYLPLIWMTKDLCDSPRNWNNLIFVQLAIAIPVFSLAYLQYFAPGNSAINLYASAMGETMDAATVGESGNIRVTGTFPYLSGMGCFVNFITLLALISYLYSNVKRAQTLGLVVLGMAAVVGLMTGSRSVVFFQMALIAASMFVARTSPNRARSAILKVIFCAAVIGLAVSQTTAIFAVNSFIERVNTTHDTLESLGGPLVAVPETVPVSGIAGWGTGSTHQARPAIERLASGGGGVYPPELFEWELPRICLELGIVGFGIWFVMKLAVTFLPFYFAMRCRNAAQRAMCLLVGIALVLQYTIPIVFNHVYSLYFWLLAGVPLAITTWTSPRGSGLRPGLLGRSEDLSSRRVPVALGSRGVRRPTS